MHRTGEPGKQYRGCVMGDVINLNQYRKQRVRQTRRKTAAANRIEHGRGKANRLTEDRERVQRERNLDGKRLDGAVEDDEPKGTG